MKVIHYYAGPDLESFDHEPDGKMPDSQLKEWMLDAIIQEKASGQPPFRMVLPANAATSLRELHLLKSWLDVEVVSGKQLPDCSPTDTAIIFFDGCESRIHFRRCIVGRPSDFISLSETAKHRSLLEGYCVGAGLDLGSGGDPIVPTSIQVERPDNYCPFFDTRYPPQLRGDATKLVWFKDNSLDYVFSSHLIEDFTPDEQKEICREWGRVIKPGGHFVILAPEQGRWREAVSKGQPPNNAHKHEPFLGYFTQMFREFGGWDVLEDRFCDATDYGMFFVSRKK